MIKVDCDICGKELDQPGALMFDPPYGELEACIKHHICRRCYQWLWEIIKKSKDSVEGQ